MSTPREILKQFWGYSEFRPLQEDIVTATLEGKDVLALLPTGGGKSICFQVPAMAKEGVCIVITPLIALMRDQVEQLKRRNIKAISLHSGMSSQEIDISLDNCAHDKSVKFLYVSPERLKSDLLIARIKKINISFIAIDEAHCISQWGFDFRPSYLEIANFRALLPRVNIIALTATATPEVQKEIQEKLAFKNGEVFTKSFARANLSYSCFETDNKLRKMEEILRKVPGSSIVYVRSRKNTVEIANYLKKKNIPASAYHAGMTTAERNTIQDLWIQNKSRIIVATNAFGMGIDKPDVRSVIHMDTPECLEAYYQEAGRAGRDEKKAFAILLYTQQELHELHTKIEQKYPSPELVRKTYQALANYLKVAVGSSLLAAYDFNEETFIKTYNLPKKETFHALRRLESEGFIQLNEGYYKPSRLMITVSNTSLYDYQLTHPEMDRFIKAILRTHGGELFENYVEISEQKIAAQAEVNTAEVRKRLNFLQSIQLMAYEPAHSSPQVVFTTFRYDAPKLPLNVLEMKARKEKELEKVRSFVHYASQDRRCRSLVLQEYFGEQSTTECGVCDICLSNKKKKTSVQDPIATEALIVRLIGEGIQDIQQLSDHALVKDKTFFIEVLQQLLDSGKLVQKKNGLLSLPLK